MLPKNIYIQVLASVLLLAAAGFAQAQDVLRIEPRVSNDLRIERGDRAPAIDLQFSRAERAWTSGGSLLEAKVRLDFVLNAAPRDVQALLLRSKVLLALDRPAQALRDAERAVGIEPSLGEAWLVLSGAARQLGDEELAQDALNSAAQHVMTDAALHIRLSWNAHALGQPRRAEAYARTALALDPSLPAAYYQLARVSVQSERHDAAVTILVRGFQEELLSSRAVLGDPVLDTLAAQPRLAPYLAR